MKYWHRIVQQPLPKLSTFTSVHKNDVHDKQLPIIMSTLLHHTFPVTIILKTSGWSGDDIRHFNGQQSVITLLSLQHTKQIELRYQVNCLSYFGVNAVCCCAVLLVEPIFQQVANNTQENNMQAVDSNTLHHIKWLVQKKNRCSFDSLNLPHTCICTV